MAKPEKRWSAFSIELLGANFWSDRTVCGRVEKRQDGVRHPAKW